MKVIGLGGHKRAGKDAAAATLREEYGFRVMGMSDALNAAMMTMNSLVELPAGLSITAHDGSRLPSNTHMRYRTLVGLCGYDEAKRVPEVRRLLQVFGTEVGREMVGEDVWVEAVHRAVVAHDLECRTQGKETRIAITGIRFINELEYIERIGGESWWIKRPYVDAETDTHASENTLIQTDFDHILINDGDLPQLKGKVKTQVGDSRLLEGTTARPMLAPRKKESA